MNDLTSSSETLDGNEEPVAVVANTEEQQNDSLKRKMEDETESTSCKMPKVDN